MAAARPRRNVLGLAAPSAANLRRWPFSGDGRPNV